MKQDSYEEGQIVECVGSVEYFHENPHGEVDGIYLDDGSEVRFPPHLGGHFFEELHFGQEIEVHATVHITKKGDVHLHAHKLVDVHNGDVLLEKEPHVHKPKGPKHDTLNQETLRALANRDRNSDEILAELRAIRRLLEERLNAS